MIGCGHNASWRGKGTPDEGTFVKRVVVFDGLNEFAVRPRATFDEYIALLQQDIATHSGDLSARTSVPCPGCGLSGIEHMFTKFTFVYVRCTSCGSIFVSPRPTPSALHAFMVSSRARRFWSSTVEVETARNRTQSIMHPRAAWVQRGASDLHRPVLVDLYTKYPTFLEIVNRDGMFSRIVSVEPVADLRDLARSPALQVLQTLRDAAAGGLTASVLSAQECLERAEDPDLMMRSGADLLQDGGLLFLTTVTCGGFDLQVLGGRSKNVLPPVHLNLLSLEGIRRFLAHHGFQIVELSTPGQLDVEIVTHAVAEDPDIVLPPFVDELIRHRDRSVHQAFQQFLQEALLSSHVRLVARKTRSGGGTG
jgi:hypothetical protein